MKRLLSVLALVCLAAGVFAADVSLGVGGSVSYYSWHLTESAGGLSGEADVTRVPFNFMAFADMTYLQIAVGYRTFHGGHETDTDPINGVTDYDYDQWSGSYASLAAYFKIPLRLGSITLFPMIGVEYDIALSGTYSDGTAWTSQTKSDSDEFWIKGGFGLDFSVSTQLYLRPELTVGYKLLNTPEKDMVDAEKALGYDVTLLPLSFEFSFLLGVRL
jgi:hypothetical protein